MALNYLCMLIFWLLVSPGQQIEWYSLYNFKNQVYIYTYIYVYHIWYVNDYIINGLIWQTQWRLTTVIKDIAYKMAISRL